MNKDKIREGVKFTFYSKDMDMTLNVLTIDFRNNTFKVKNPIDGNVNTISGIEQLKQSGYKARDKEVERLRDAVKEIHKRAVFQIGKDPKEDSSFILTIGALAMEALRDPE